MMNLEEQTPKQNPDFINKLLKMMKHFPDTLNFSEDGSQLVIFNKTEFINKALAENFRHTNWRSFIRQLNMYNFRKINRGNDKEIFYNSTFQRGNEANYHKIRRKINCKQDQGSYERELQKKAELIIEENYGKISPLSTFISTIFTFRSSAEDMIISVKKDLEDLGVKKKTKETKPIIQQIKESFQMIEETSQKFTYSLENFSKNSQVIHQSKIQTSGILNFEKPSFRQIDVEFSQQIFSLLPQEEKFDKTEERMFTQEKLKQIQEKRKESREKLGVTQRSSFSSVTNLVN